MALAGEDAAQVGFADHFQVMAEMVTSAHHVVHAVKRKKDGATFILKAVCLLGKESSEREAIVLEAVRWRHTLHPRLLQVLSVTEEPGFVYTLYEHALGRDLFSTMWSRSNMAEHSAKAIISAVLSALSYCHKKGIVHGNVDPRNIVFAESARRAGWMHSAKLCSFVEYDKAPGAVISRATDFKDVAYLMAWLLMNTDDAIRDLNRSTFKPGVLHALEWAHVSPEAFDLIDRLWADGTRSNAADFLEHPWFRTGAESPDQEEDPNAIPWSPSKILSPRTAMEGWVWKKDINKDRCGRRQWRRKFAQLQGTTLLFYNEEPSSVRVAAAAAAAAEKERTHTDANRVAFMGGSTEAEEERLRQAEIRPDLPKAVSLIDCTVLEFPSLKYQYVFTIRHLETQQNLVYVRCDSQEEDRRWRRAIANQIAADHTAAQKLALSTALNFLTPGFAAASNHGGDVKLDIGKGGLVMRVSESEQAGGGANSRRGSRASLRSSDDSVVTATMFDAYYPEGSWKHPAEHWNNRSEELDRVLKSGKPPSAPVVAGDIWFIVDATWFKHWFTFVTSTRRMSPPGPINNNWMINPRKNTPFRDLREDTDNRPGDFRRVTPEIWAIFMEIYGGGPAIWVTGPPLDHTKRWQVEGLDTQTAAQPSSILSKLFSSDNNIETKSASPPSAPIPAAGHRRSKSAVSFSTESIRRRSSNDLYGRRKFVEVKSPTSPVAEEKSPLSGKPVRMAQEHKSPVPPKETRDSKMFSKLGSVYQQARDTLLGAKEQPEA